MKNSGPLLPDRIKKDSNKLNNSAVHCLYLPRTAKQRIMKTSRLFLFALLSVSMVFLSSCKEDEEPEESSFIGDYVIVNATTSEPLTLTTNEIGDITVPQGMDITVMIQDALLGAIQCDPASSIIELHEDFSLFLSCATSMEEIDAGTWEEQSETVIILNLNSTAIPSSPTGIVLTVTDVTLVGSLLSGSTSVPIPKDMLATIVSLMSGGLATLDMDATPDAIPLTFTIQLEKQ